MNAKKMLMFAMLGGATVAHAATLSVKDVKVTPRYPWNGLVDIDYYVVSDDLGADVYVTPVAYDADRRMTVFPVTLSGDGAASTVKAGQHRMTWDATADLGTFSSSRFHVEIYAGFRLPRYVKIDLSSGSESENYPVMFSCVGPAVESDACRTTELWLRLIPAGEFWMGSPTDELGRSDNEDLHHVTLTKPFYMGVFEVTQKQWELVMGTKPSYFQGTANEAIRPVEQISYADLRANSYPSGDPSGSSFFAKLRSRTQMHGFDLPSEARWEYACRAGTKTALYTGKNLSFVASSHFVNEIARNFANGWGSPAPDKMNESYGTARVGSYKPNALGLYDMLGNVTEICRDGAYNNTSHLGYDDVTDPLNTNSGPGPYYTLYYYIVTRGGSFSCKANKCRSGNRPNRDELHSYTSYQGAGWTTSSELGFRVCAEAEF